MSETDEQFVERISREVYPGFDGWRTVSMMDHSLDRLITLARRGAAVQCKPCRLCGALQHWMPLLPPPAGETSDE